MQGANGMACYLIPKGKVGWLLCSSLSRLPENHKYYLHRTGRRTVRHMMETSKKGFSVSMTPSD